MKRQAKNKFQGELKEFVKNLAAYTCDETRQWTIKGFIDIFRNVYVISADTKVISKIIELHLLPKLMEFAQKQGYNLVLPDHQNHYPDISFVNKANEKIKFAVDIKTSYRLPHQPNLCNGFTLGSHGRYFIDRNSRKNIQFPYNDYLGHYCLGVIYTRSEAPYFSESSKYTVKNIKAITSVIRDLQFFTAEKWRIAGDKSGSGNTANIGSITYIDDIINEQGMFSKLGEAWFNDYWMNYNKIVVSDKNGEMKKINTLPDFVRYRKGNPALIVPKRRRI